MDITCDIIRDLLPLYAEDLVSEDSKNLVEEHLCTCDSCTKQLGILKKAAQLPVEVDTGALKRVGNAIRRRKIMAVLAVILVVISLAASVYTWMTVPVALPMEEAIVSVEKIPEGGIRKTLWEYAVALTSLESGNNKGFVMYTTRARQLMWQFSPYKTKQMEEHGILLTKDGRYISFINDEGFLDYYGGEIVSWAHEFNHWYLNIYNGTAENLMWDAGADYPENMQMRCPDYKFLWLLAVSLGAAVLLAVGSRFVRNETGSALMQRFAVLAGSIAYADIITCGNRFVCLENIYEDFNLRSQYIAVLALIVCITGLFCLRVHRMNRQDKIG